MKDVTASDFLWWLDAKWTSSYCQSVLTTSPLQFNNPKQRRALQWFVLADEAMERIRRCKDCGPGMKGFVLCVDYVKDFTGERVEMNWEECDCLEEVTVGMRDWLNVHLPVEKRKTVVVPAKVAIMERGVNYAVYRGGKRVVNGVFI